jgi:hypothetical protein
MSASGQSRHVGQLSVSVPSSFSHSAGNGFSKSWSSRVAGCVPAKIASTMLGASSVRSTEELILFEQAQLIRMIASFLAQALSTTENLCQQTKGPSLWAMSLCAIRSLEGRCSITFDGRISAFGEERKSVRTSMSALCQLRTSALPPTPNCTNLEVRSPNLMTPFRYKTGHWKTCHSPRCKQRRACAGVRSLTRCN